MISNNSLLSEKSFFILKKKIYICETKQKERYIILK